MTLTTSFVGHENSQTYAYKLNCHVENKMNEFWISMQQIKKLKQQLKHEEMNTGRRILAVWRVVAPIYYSGLSLGPSTIWKTCS